VIEFSQTSFAQEGLTGHTWRKSPQNIKIVFIRAFVVGFLAGRVNGYRNGAAHTYVLAEMLVCKCEKDIACIDFRKLSSEWIKEIETKSGETKDLESSMDYYVKEVDSFYETFPLCRGRMLENTLSKLTPMWLGIAVKSEDSYNKIGSVCGEQNK
jgi:hypothetical protein